MLSATTTKHAQYARKVTPPNSVNVNATVNTQSVRLRDHRLLRFSSSHHFRPLTRIIGIHRRIRTYGSERDGNVVVVLLERDRQTEPGRSRRRKEKRKVVFSVRSPSWLVARGSCVRVIFFPVFPILLPHFATHRRHNRLRRIQ